MATAPVKLTPLGSALLQRAEGAVRVAARRRGAETVLADLYQKGAAKAMLPRAPGPGLTAVLLNTAGGMTGGDRFAITGVAGAGADLTLTTQTAERAYRALPGTRAEVSVALRAGPGARLAWLAQETILFDGAALSRHYNVDLADDAAFLAVEPVILGRAAMGETVTRLAHSDQWRIRRGGRLVWADALRLHGNPEEIVNDPAVLDGHRAFATLILVAPDAERHLARLRGALAPAGAASLIRPGVLAARLTAPDGFGLRRTLMPALEVLTGADLPKTWRL